MILPDNEVILWEGQHKDAKECGESSMSDWSKCVLHSKTYPLISAAYTCHKPLKQSVYSFE